MSSESYQEQLREALYRDGYGRRADEVEGDTLSPPGVIVEGGQIVRFETRTWFPSGANFPGVLAVGVDTLIVGPNDVPPGADRAEFRVTVPVSGYYKFHVACLTFLNPEIIGECRIDFRHFCTPADNAGRTLQIVDVNDTFNGNQNQFEGIGGESYWLLEAGELYVFQATIMPIVGTQWQYYVDPNYARAALELTNVLTG